MSGSLQHSVSWIGSELDRLERQAADLQTHVADLMNVAPSNEALQGASDLQDLDRITQVLQNLATFANTLSHEIPAELHVDLNGSRDGLSLGELRTRLEGGPVDPTSSSVSGDVDFF